MARQARCTAAGHRRQRRCPAVRPKGRLPVAITAVDLATAGDVLRAELDENTCRKSLTPYEASRAREWRAKVLEPTQPKGGRGKTSSNLDEVSAARALGDRA